MFFLLSFIANIGYALQNSFMAAYYRKIDSLSAVTYRGLSLLISMLPVLYFVEDLNANLVISILPLISLASFFTVIANAQAALVYQYLPLGIAGALCVSSATIFATLFGFLFLSESPNYIQSVCIVSILCLVFFLGSLTNSEKQHEYQVKKGLIATFLFAFFIATGYIFMGRASREIDPLLSGYLWEGGIGICGVILTILRKFSGGKPLEKISFQDFYKILLYSSPTVFATACFSLAIKMGPMSIVLAIIATGIIINCILGSLLYKEKLTWKQWGVILLICGVVVLLKYNS
ncbi:MAG: DMT family transporter [Proteobacteria bacterium]|nr:DMT family transporter [Pseudomonadota bacterium]